MRTSLCIPGEVRDRFFGMSRSSVMRARSSRLISSALSLDLPFDVPNFFFHS